MESERRLRLVGLCVAASTPVTGFFTYAVVAILIGEARLESDGGLTPLGWLAISVPVFVGLIIATWGHRARVPSARGVGLGVLVLAVACGGLGWWSASSHAAEGDASIGGGLLMLASVPLAITGGVLAVWGSGRRSPRA